jgi:hypothetical protein
MTFEDLQNLTAYWLDDLQFGYFTPVQVKLWLNNAQREVQKILLQSRANFYVTPVQTTLVVNQSDYVLPSDFMTIHRGEIVTTGSPPNEDLSPLAPMTINQQDLVPSRTGTPQFYFLKKNRIRVFPSPDTALTLRIYYSYTVSDMVLPTDSPDIPSPYHEFLAVLATIDGLIKDGRDLNAILQKRSYYENLLKQETQERNEDAPRGIVQTGSDLSQMFGYF